MAIAIIWEGPGEDRSLEVNLIALRKVPARTESHREGACKRACENAEAGKFLEPDHWNDLRDKD